MAKSRKRPWVFLASVRSSSRQAPPAFCLAETLRHARATCNPTVWRTPERLGQRRWGPLQQIPEKHRRDDARTAGRAGELRARSYCRHWLSTCWTTGCATCWIPASGDGAPNRWRTDIAPASMSAAPTRNADSLLDGMDSQACVGATQGTIAPRLSSRFRLASPLPAPFTRAPHARQDTRRARWSPPHHLFLSDSIENGIGNRRRASLVWSVHGTDLPRFDAAPLASVHDRKAGPPRRRSE